MEKINDQFVKEAIALKSTMEDLLITINEIINNYFTIKSGLKDGDKLKVQLEAYRNQVNKMKLN